MHRLLFLRGKDSTLESINDQLPRDRFTSEVVFKAADVEIRLRNNEYHVLVLDDSNDLLHVNSLLSRHPTLYLIMVVDHMLSMASALDAYSRGVDEVHVSSDPPKLLAWKIRRLVGEPRQAKRHRQLSRMGRELIQARDSVQTGDFVDVSEPGHRENKLAEGSLDFVERMRKGVNALTHDEVKLVFDAATHGFRILDKDFTVVCANQSMSRMAGYPAEEMIGSKCYDTFPGETCNTRNCTLLNLKKGESGTSREVWKNHRDGTSVPCLVTAQAITDSSGQLQGFVEVFQDITEIRRLQSIAETVNTMNTIGYVFSGIRHELGNPINALKTSLAVLQRKFTRFSKEEIADYLQRSLRDVGRVEFLLHSLKSFSMYEKLHLEATSIRAFLEECEKLIAADVEKRHICFTVDCPTDELECAIDPRALQQVLLNLVANAIDACGERDDPRITVGAHKKESALEIRVKDNGAGMTTEVLEHVFQPFYTTKPKGTGLGLVIAKKMVSLMKGDIEVQSERGGGTEVVLTLPVLQTRENR